MTTQRGFTLIEMAIVLVIITILIGGLAMPLAAQIKARRIAETQKTMEEARDAIVGYAMTHKTLVGNKPYLPCPDSNGDGIEDARTANKCPQQFGFLPWVTLGIGSQDAWGNRLLYATNTDVSNDSAGINPAVVVPSASWNQVCSSHTCATVIAANLPVVLVSLGPNGWGAHNINGSMLAAPSGTDELENLDGDNIFVSRFPTKPGDPNGEFDDLVSWMPYYVLFPRVCPTGCS